MRTAWTGRTGVSAGTAVAATGGMAAPAFIFYHGGYYGRNNHNKDKGDDNSSKHNNLLFIPAYALRGFLNKAQQNAVAQGLQEERGRGDYSSTPYVDGEKIYLGMNNFLRRSGRGEIVTSRR